MDSAQPETPGRPETSAQPATQAATDDWHPIDPRVIRSKVLIVAIVFVASLVLTFAPIVIVATGIVPVEIVGSLAGQPQPNYGVLFSLLALVFSCYITAITCMVITLPLSHRLRQVTPARSLRASLIGKAVRGRKPVELDDEQQILAARYASTAWIVYAFQSAGVGLLFLGLCLFAADIAQLGELPLTMVIAGILSVLAALGFISMIVTYPVLTRRARRYARNHPAH